MTPPPDSTVPDRIVDRYGRALRAVAVPSLRVLTVAATVVMMVIFSLSSPIFATPEAIGTDASNYYAAGLRLNDGHPLYELSPGDRPVPLDPPYWSIPLLAPPPIGVLWRALALFGDGSMTLWWLGCIAATLVAVATIAVRGPVPVLIAATATSPAFAASALSANANSYLLLALAGVWVLRDRRPALAGALVAVVAAVKLAPLLLGAWVLVRGGASGRRGLLGLIAGGAVIGAISLAGAGLENHLAYLASIGSSGTGAATWLSPPGIAAALGVPASLAGLAIPVLAFAALALAVRWRGDSRRSFAVLAAAAAVATPAVSFSTFVLAAAALAPWLTGRAPGDTTALDRPGFHLSGVGRYVRTVARLRPIPHRVGTLD